MIEIVAPVMYRDVYLGMVCCGPLMMWEWDEVALKEIVNLTENVPVSREALLVASQKVMSCDSQKVNALADEFVAAHKDDPVDWHVDVLLDEVQRDIMKLGIELEMQKGE